MSSQNNFDYSQFGGTRIEPPIQNQPIRNPQFIQKLDENTQQPQPQTQDQYQPQIQQTQQNIDYSQFGGQKISESNKKTGTLGSIGYGAQEAVLGLPALAEIAIKKLVSGVQKGVSGGLNYLGLGNETTEAEQEPKSNYLAEYISTFPESEGETARRVRAGTQGVVSGIPFGIPGIIAGLVGSQAGQTIREVYGKDGKFENFFPGEAGALVADVLAGGAAGIGTELARQVPNVAQQAGRVPTIFTRPETGLQRAIVKNTIQNENKALKGIISNFSNQQIQGFEQQVSRVSPNRYSQIIQTQSNPSILKRTADNMFRSTQLRSISPLNVTKEQGGRALQESANALFQTNVLQAERAAYTAARNGLENVSGTTPRTIQQARRLLGELTTGTPTPEQGPTINYLQGLIHDLEAGTTPITKTGNELIDLIQNGNQAVNYGSELRLQSHRLQPVLNTLRQESGQIFSQNPQAHALYNAANQLHANNAEVWGTRFMRDLRFTENPENIVGKTKLASNLRNYKQAVDDPAIQALADRLAVENITQTGKAESNRTALRNLAPELSPNAREAAVQLINVKDPLTNVGARASIRNEILSDAAKSVNTGTRPETILNLMETPKGYSLVRESLSGTPEGRQLFNTFERLFVEDIFSSTLDKTGQIDFNKARNIFKSRDVRDVVQTIGGENLIQRFNELEGFSRNLNRNLELYKSPEAQSLFKSLLAKVKTPAIIGVVLHSLHMPTPLLAALGFAKGTYEGGKLVVNTLQKKILSNPKAVRILEKISLASSTQQLEKQLPRLITEIEKSSDEDQTE